MDTTELLYNRFRLTVILVDGSKDFYVLSSHILLHWLRIIASTLTEKLDILVSQLSAENPVFQQGSSLFYISHMTRVSQRFPGLSFQIYIYIYILNHLDSDTWTIVKNKTSDRPENKRALKGEHHAINCKIKANHLTRVYSRLWNLIKTVYEAEVGFIN